MNYTAVLREDASSFPRWIMTVCATCGGVIVDSSPSPHPSFPTCKCEPGAKP